LSKKKKKKAKYTRQTPRVGCALLNHQSQKKLRFQRAAAKKREAGLELRFAYTRRAYLGHGPKQGLSGSQSLHRPIFSA